MDRETTSNGNSLNNTELGAVRDANRASTHVPAYLLEKLKLLQTHQPNSAPEISVLKIPAVQDDSAETHDDKASAPDTLPWASTNDASPPAEQSPTQNGESLSSTTNSLRTVGTPPAGAAAPKIFEQSGSPTKAAAPRPGQSQPVRGTPAAQASGGGQSATQPTGVAWFQSISNAREDRPIQEICQRLQTQYPRPVHAQLLFTSADPAISTNRTVGRIAAALVQATNHDVLLVDANLDANLGLAKSQDRPPLGLAEVLAQGFDWRPLVLATQTVGLRVLPCGAMDVPARQIDSGVLMKLAAEWRRDYAYVLINGGFVKQLLTRRIAVSCDGAYVMVELNRTTKTDAQAATRILAENKARPMGAIVFDSAHDS